MVGGGAESFMGNIHRAAIEQCGTIELVCGAFGSTRHSSFETGKLLRLPPKRSYGTYRDMFRREAVLPADERMQFVTVLAPNTMHYPVAMSAIDANFPVFSEKPFTCNMDEALNLTRKQQNSGLAYGIAFAYAGYPMLLRAKALVTDEKAVGNIRKVVASYELGWMAQRLETAGNKQAGWRADPRRCGPAGSLIDLGIHCFHLTEWVTGVAVSELCADTRATVAGRVLDDDCSVLVRLAGGPRGVFLCSQIATGSRQGLSLEVYGDKGAVLWSQSRPDRLTLRALDGTEQAFTGGTPADAPQPPFAPNPYGDNAAYIAALAESYRSFATFLEAPKKAAQREGGLCFARIEEGLRAVAFVDAALKSTSAPEEGAPPPAKWMPVIVPPIPEL
jgi:predicted dehydrogenase